MRNRISSARWGRTLFGAGLTSTAILAAPAVQAQVALPMIAPVANIGLMLPASAAALAGTPCPVNPSPALAAQASPIQSKSAAVAGTMGGMTALERMVQAQAGQAASTSSEAAYGGGNAVLPTPAPSPTAQFSILGLGQCAGKGSAIERAALVMPTSAPQTEFLSSRRIKIGRTSFEADWRRVKRAGVSKEWAGRRVAADHGDREKLVAAVNAYANHAIRYAEDRDLWGKADYWANAKTTFRLGKGDCEDIAIAKMQMLAALGIDRNDMVLTLAKDLVRRADHAVLIVKLDGRFVMLDNTVDTLIDASVSQDYRPVLSFGDTQSWLHGY